MNYRTNFHPSRDLRFTRIVYGGTAGTGAALGQIEQSYNPPPSPYQVRFGEIHGHTELSDGQGGIDAYFRTARDVAKLDFCALTDHDHGGVGRPELWAASWALIQKKVAAYHAPGSFVTLLGYERDSFPFYPNMDIYYRAGTGEMIRGRQDGEITLAELEALAARKDILFVPHQISQIEVGVNWKQVPLPVMPRVAEIYSKWGASEFFGNPRPIRSAARGNYWQDALELGARIGCIAGSDIHSTHPGLPVRTAHGNLRHEQPGIAAVRVKDFTREAIFDAIQARRCYACEGTRMELELRINGAEMGSEIRDGEKVERGIYVSVKAPAPIAKVEIIKNARVEYAYYLDSHPTHTHTSFVMDLEAERATDYYYVRVTQMDGLRCWSSPIWVDR